MRVASPAILTLGALLLAGGCAGDDGAACEGACTSAVTSDASASSAATSTSSGGDPGGEGETDETSAAETTTSGGVRGSAGCGKPPVSPSGGVVVELDVGPEGDGLRTFFLSLPADYDPQTPHRLILGYPGTDWTGEMIRPYLDLEGEAGDGVPEIFAYPDPLWREFAGWGTFGGWLLGPHAAPAAGDQDLHFTGRLLDHLADHYCIDEDRVFATGHSWGGDMAMVAACFLGDRLAAAAPVAANEPYWFRPAPGEFVDCPGATAVWVYFGQADDHFGAQDYPGEYGDAGRDFWIDERACAGVDAAEDLGLGDPGECVAYQGCASDVRYCLYGAEFGHQVPDYYSAAVMAWFRGF